MKKACWLVLLAAMVGCGDGAPPEPTAEQKAEMDTKMDTDMKNMMGEMQKGAPPGTAQPPAP